MVSIVIPAYNAGNYIVDCVYSIIHQNYNDYEVIIVDDGSTDNTKEIIRKMQLENDKIHYFFQKNSGVAVARNLGMKHSKGKYIMFVDADDKVSHTLVDTLVKEAERGYDIVACSCTVFDDTMEYEEFFLDGECTFEEQNKSILYEQLISMSAHHPQPITTALGVPWGKLYRKDFLEAYSLQFNKDLRRAQDNIFNMYAFYYAKSIKYINKPLYMYRLDHIASYKNNPMQLYNVIEARYIFFMEHPKVRTKNIEKLYTNEILFNLIVSMYRIVKAGEDQSQLKKIAEMPIYDEYIKKIKFGNKWFLLFKLIELKQFSVVYKFFMIAIFFRRIKRK